MIEATVDGTLCWLVTDEPDWSSAPSVEFAARSSRSDGLTLRESRVRVASATEASLKTRLLLEGAEASNFDARLAEHDNRPVLAPFWPGACLLSDVGSTPWGDGLRIFFEPDWSAWQIRPGAQAPTSFAPTVDCMTAPLTWSRFDKLPATELLTPTVHQVDIATVETGLAAYALAPRPVTLPGGPLVGGISRPSLPVTPAWTSEPQKIPESRITRKKLGNARGEAEEYYPHTPRFRYKLGFTMTGIEAALLAELFRQSGGTARPWWSPSWAEYTYLDAPAAGAQIVVAAAEPLVGCTAIALVSPEGDIAVRTIVGRAGNTLTLDSAPGDFPIDTAVTPAQLCRFATDKLGLKYTSPECVTATVEVVTLPTEAADVLGYEGSSAALIHVTDGANVWLYTDHDAPIDAGALGVAAPIQIEVGRCTEEINLEAHNSSLELRPFAGCPFLRLINESESYVLTVAVYEVDPESPATSVQLLHTYRALRPKSTGPILTVDLGGFESILDTKGPRQLMQDTCCAAFGDAKCAKVLSALGMTAISSAGTALDLVLPDPAPEASTYSYGFAERTLSAGRTQRWTIRSAEIVAGVFRLHLDGTIYPAAAADESWDLYVGCAGTWAACQGHANTENFRAFPHTPTRTPSIVPVTTTTGGKK